MTKRINTGEAFAKLLNKEDLSISQASKLTHISNRNLCFYLKNMYKPNANSINKLSRGLNITVDDLTDVFNMRPSDKTFGSIIRASRYQENISERDLGHRMGVSQQRVYMIEHSKSVPHTETIIKLAKGFNIRPSELWKKYLIQCTNPSHESARLKFILLDEHLSDTEGAIKCHIGFSKFNKLLNRKKSPTPRDLIKIGQGLGLNIKELFKNSEYNEKYTETFGYWLLKKECQPKWSNNKIIKKLGCSRQTLSNYIRNVYLPDEQSRVKIKKLLSS